MGKTPKESIQYFFHDPIRVIQLLFINHNNSHLYDGIKMEFYLVHILSGGFILLWRPVFIIPFVPLIAKKMYNNDPVRWCFESYYAIEIVSILPLLCFWALLSSKFKTYQLPLLRIIICSTLIVTFYQVHFVGGVHNGIRGNANKYNFLSANFYKPCYNISEINIMLNSIPKNAAVSAASVLVPHLAYRKKIYYFPNISDAEYIVYLKNADNWPLRKNEFTEQTEQLIKSGSWKIISESKDFCLLKKVL